MGRDRDKGRDRDQDADWEFTPPTDDDDESPYYGQDHNGYHDDAQIDDVGSANHGALMVGGGVAGDIATLGNGSREVEPVLIPGTGLSMGSPFIKRRERPLTMRLAMITIMVCLLVTGLFAVTPLRQLPRRVAATRSSSFPERLNFESAQLSLVYGRLATPSEGSGQV